jgi:hypothetical protein
VEDADREEHGDDPDDGNRRPEDLLLVEDPVP